MLTKSDFELLWQIHNHKGKITFTEQTIFTNRISFYRSIKALKDKQLIIANPSMKDNQIYCIYEITFKGITLYKILND